MAGHGCNDLITVDPDSTNPDKAWKRMMCKYKKVKPLATSELRKEGYTRFVCVSDTHSKTDHRMMPPIPDGDILLHAGDFTMHSGVSEIDLFSKWLEGLPHKYKIVIAGNHDQAFDQTRWPLLKKYFGIKFTDSKLQLKNCIYLEDSAVTVLGFKIYGSPWQPQYHPGAFNLSRGQALLDKWNMIPSNIDVLLTHTPPLGHGDESTLNGHAGCVDLLNTVQQRVKPLYHVFGHIHEGYGVTTNGNTVFINAAICNEHFKPCHEPIIFDLPHATSLPDES
ncbi:metallophosphoesterase domain-containing protein 1-like [Saccoglossus kowalevskii]|uniref:Metallophosphoesterase domain-containing protein 1-like n=1 Tax=Saccoglossus kowalevskii TaxID=10224 RepID=A0ABM0MH09_SACKO|nr:PREDICTED: metallophosphoesterase domain-containing protein 1-like [Saccoglossus kowalevskii]